MSIQLVESEVRRFLSTREPEVICISGIWGVGKTFAWNRYVKEAKNAGDIALKHYSYVSLFGIDSLDELRYSIFENSIKSAEIGIEPNLKTLRTNTAAVVNSLGRKAVPILQNVPVLKDYLGGLGPALFLSIRETIICIDDLERRGEHLKIRDVLGLVSSLKEHRRCKVCLILNSEALEESKKDFLIYFEKAVDISITFAPTATECVSIALPEKSTADTLLSKNCTELGVANIRLIRKLDRLVKKIEPLVASFVPEVLEQAIHSLALLGWSHYEPTRAPSIEFLQKRQLPDLLDIHKKEPIPPNEASWNALLDVYRFRNLDNFDLALLDGVRSGFFDPETIQARGAELDRAIKAGALNGDFWTAWGMLHDSFSNNQEEVLNAIYKSFLNGVDHISHTNMNATVRLFKQLGRKDQAGELICERYLNPILPARVAHGKLLE